MIKRFFISFFLILAFISSKAQSWADERQHPVNVYLSEVALIDIQPNSNDIVFAIVPPTSAGNPPEVMVSNDDGNVKWLNYTNALVDFSTSRNIFVEITYGSVPSGIELSIEANEYSGTGLGQHGKSVGKVKLINGPVLLIWGIKGCFTGIGLSNGHKLTYSAVIKDNSLLDPDEDNTVEITYTITDN